MTLGVLDGTIISVMLILVISLYAYPYHINRIEDGKINKALDITGLVWISLSALYALYTLYVLWFSN